MSRKAMQVALEALESDPISHAGPVTVLSSGKGTGFNYFRALGITVLRQALVDADDTLQKRVDEKEKREHEPVAWRTFDGEGGYDYRSYEMNENYDKEWAERNPNHAHWVEPLYASPQKQWVGLTDEDMEALFLNEDGVRFARYIEAKLKEKNT
jgi:hypothetical protein